MIQKRNKDKYFKQLALNYRNGAKMKKCMAAIHLEADFDKLFWQKIFNHILPTYKDENRKYYERRGDLKEYLTEDIHFNRYPEINKIEKDIRTFFHNN